VGADPACTTLADADVRVPENIAPGTGVTVKHLSHH
jgi:hypothetical protein